MVKKAIFTSQNSSIEVAIINNECDIPTEILKARNIVLLGVYAYKVTEDKLDLRYSPSPDAFKVNSGSYIEGANESEEITPSQFEQYMQALNDGLNKVGESIKKMDSATSAANDLVEDISQKLENGDFIGPQGPQGPQGVPGKNGTNGQDGVGITTITSGQSTIEEDKTITPVTVTKTDGSSQIFKVEAKNGLDGQNGQDGKDGVNGQDGLTPSIGENGNWFLGDTDTGKPSRGEAGPSPDLSNYVKNTDYANTTKAGVFKPTRNLYVNPETGYVYAQPVSKEEYNSSEDTIFMAKGTIENIKDDYVGSSNPVITLNSTLDNLVRKNRVSDYIISLKDALKYKVFEFLVHGKVKQETTTGKNLLNYLNVKQFVSNGLLSIINNDGSITTTGIPTMNYAQIMNLTDITDMLEDGQTYTIMQKNATNKLYIQVNITTNSDESVYVGLNNNTENIKTFTVDKQNNKKYMIDIQSNSIETTGELNITNYYQLLKGSYDEWQPFEKYTGGQPSPNPDYPQETTTLTFSKITRCGKNIFDYDKFLNDIGDSLTIEGTNNNFTYRSNNSIASTLGIFKFNFKEKTSYSFSGKISSSSANGAMKVIYTDETSFYIYSKWDGTSLSEEFFKTTDETKTIKQIEISSYGNGTVFELTDFMISEGSTATDCEPYQGQTYDIDLQGNEMVEIPDSVKDNLIIDKEGNVSLIKKIDKMVLDGSEVWELSSFSNDTILSVFFNIQTMKYISKFTTNKFSYANRVSVATDYEYCSTGGQSIRIGIAKSRLVSSDIAGFKQWLSENNIQLYYQLANPQTIPLGKLTNLIETEEGINNFFINGNLETTLEVLYARDSEKYLQQYIDDKLATLSQAIIEVEEG